MFQSTMRRDLGGQSTNLNGAKLPETISCIATLPCSHQSELRKNVLLGKPQIQWVVDLRPWRASGRSEAYAKTFVDEFLDSNIEELVHAACIDQVLHLGKEARVDELIEYRDANVRSAEL